MRNYVRKTNRGNTPEELMQAAAFAVLQQGKSLRTISKELGICHATLFRFLRKLKAGEKPTVGYKPKLLFTESQEQEIVKHLAQFAKVFCGLTIDDIKKLSYQFAKRWKYQIPDSWYKNNSASKEWADKFIIRHNFHLKPSKGNIKIHYFYNMLHKLMEEHKFLPSRIYYLEVITIPVIKYVAKDKRRSLYAHEKSIGAELAANALGETIKPRFLMYPDDYKLNDQSKLCSGSKTMITTEFLRYLDHIVCDTKPCKEDPVLLLLDDCKYVDMNVLKKANQNSIILLAVPKSAVDMKPFEKLAKYLKKGEKYQELWLEPEKHDVLDLFNAVLPDKDELVKCFRENGLWPFNPSAITGEDFVPGAVVEYGFKVREQPAQPVPGPSNASSTTTSGAHAFSVEQDPLSKGTAEQCRFCGEFSRECVSVVNMPYLSTNRTTLAFNDVIVQIDFNDETLSKTICKDCDAKLQEMFDFVRVVKNAQRFLINVKVQERVEVDVEVDQGALETLVVKTECEESNDEKDDVNDGKDDSNDEKDDDDKHDSNDEKDDDDEEHESKDGIVDSLTVSETIFIKETLAPKRKSTTCATKSKRTKVTEKIEEDNELIIDIKEEVIEKDTNDGNDNTGCVSDTGTDDKPSEVELATSALVFEMRGDAGGYS